MQGSLACVRQTVRCIHVYGHVYVRVRVRVCVTKYREHSCLHHVNLVINTQCTWIQSEILVIAMETAVETIRHAVQTCSPISQ